MAGKRAPRCWVSMITSLILVVLAVAGLAVPSLAGSLLPTWFAIGTDASLPHYDQLNAAVAFNPDRQEYLVVWHNERPEYPDIQAQRVGVNGQLIGGPFYIAGGPNAQRRYPDIVYNPAHQEYLVVWEEIPDVGRVNVYAQRVEATGGLILGATALGTGPELAGCTRPAVGYASTSDLYMVVWERSVQGSLSGDIEAQVLSGTGTTVGGNLLIATGTTTVHHEDPDIAYNRSRNEYLVVWTREDKSGPIKDIWGRIMTRDGDLLGSELLIGYHTVDETHAAVAGVPTTPNYGGYYVIWELEYGPGDGDIYGREVGWDGLLGSNNAISDDRVNDTEPVIAYNEAQAFHFVAWSRVTNVGVNMSDIVGFAYLPGAPQSSRASFIGGWSYAERPAVAAGPGSDFLVVWDDAPFVADRDVYGRLWGERTYIYLPIVMR